MKKAYLWIFILIMFVTGCTSQKQSYNAETYEYSEEIQVNTVVETEDTSDETKNVEMVYITDSGKCYHKDGCRYLYKSSIEIGYNDAVRRGFRACSVCS